MLARVYASPFICLHNQLEYHEFKGFYSKATSIYSADISGLIKFLAMNETSRGNKSCQ